MEKLRNAGGFLRIHS